MHRYMEQIKFATLLKISILDSENIYFSILNKYFKNY